MAIDQDRARTGCQPGGRLVPSPRDPGGAGIQVLAPEALDQSLIDAMIASAQRSAPERQAALNAVATLAISLLACALPFMAGSLLAVPFACLASAVLLACAAGLDRVFSPSCVKQCAGSPVSASFSLIPAPAAVSSAPAAACAASALLSSLLPASAALALAALVFLGGAALAAAHPGRACEIAAIISPVRLLRGASVHFAVPFKGRARFMIIVQGTPAFAGLHAAPLKARFVCRRIAVAQAL